ncbi:6-bladed beta-propeller [Bacteroides muris (ex Fokt et al. 2023)]|uniref:6-bladed beta-propeller n=2 Tax=Bacteroides TaxID=816 RepID=A0A9X2NRM2_9BACE|nr:6-bladed beta-propeller [Bacteroides muris (ex Fokt et al. 2023)]MCR6503542.1 6-bladed beta-propeller [Bacteroides muris (ex Fokt et al. 2023)]
MEISFGLRKILAFCLVIALLSGCKKTDKQQTFNGKTVNFAMEKLAEQQNMLNRVDSISFIPLNAVCEDALLKQINKCSVVDDKIYLLDYFGNASLTVWDNTGTFLYKIGHQGQGPGEYSKITDFDVANQNIYLLDSGQRKILKYNLNGDFKDEYSYNGKLEGVNDLIVTSDGNFLLGLDVELSMDNQLILTDSEFNIKQVLLSFDERTTRGHLNIGSLRRCATNIVYYYPISDDIYILNATGEVKEKYEITFNKSIPKSMRNNYQEVVKQRKSNEFSYFYETPFVCGNFLLSSIFYGSKKAMLAMDLEKQTFSKVVYNKDIVLSISHFNFPIYMDETRIYCWLNSAAYNLFDEESKKRMGSGILKHLENGEDALVVYYLKPKK